MSPSGPAHMSPLCPVPVPEDDEWTKRVNAYADGETPAFWTPEHVMCALVDAYDVLRRGGGRVGPKSGGNGWPEWIRDEAENVERVARPTSIEASQCDAALSWALSHLSSNQLGADALGLWASCQALGRSAEQVISKRRKVAKRAATAMQEVENRSFEVAKSRAVADVVAWSNRKLADARTAAQRANIASNAHIRLGRLMQNLKPAQIHISDGMPGKVISMKALDFHRKIAAAIISDKLNLAGIVPWAVSLPSQG